MQASNKCRVWVWRTETTLMMFARPDKYKCSTFATAMSFAVEPHGYDYVFCFSGYAAGNVATMSRKEPRNLGDRKKDMSNETTILHCCNCVIIVLVVTLWY